MKKLVSLLVLFTYMTLTVFAADDIRVYLNGSELEFDQPPVISNDYTLVPFRAIFEGLGMEVAWNGGENRVTASGNGTEISLQINRPAIYINGSEKALAVSPVIINDRTLVPLRAVSEAAGAEVLWNGDTRTVTITTENESLESLANKVLTLTNAERTKQGMNPLTLDTGLTKLADTHCADMIERGFFNHNNPDGKTPFDRLNEAGVSYWLAGENIAAGQTSAESAVTDWMNSKTHRQNILNPAFKSIGISVRMGGEYGIYWVQEFALLNNLKK